MYLGEVTPEQCLAAASDKDPKRDKEMKCEAYFYVGQFYLIRGDKERASESFRRCIATGLTSYREYIYAQGELKRLGKPEK
jgi:lipoprotein NlpI